MTPKLKRGRPSVLDLLPCRRLQVCARTHPIIIEIKDRGNICPDSIARSSPATRPLLASAHATTAPPLKVQFDNATGAIEVRNASGFELSANGKDYVGAAITAHDSSSVTLAVPSSITTMVSLRYILHDTPCINETCAVYGATTGLPSPPLVANLLGHSGADQVCYNMSTRP